jgi:heat shock protein HtpX
MAQIFKTTLLLSVLTGLFLAVGYFFGGQSGALIALLFAAVFNFGTYWFSSSLVLKMQGAKPLDSKHESYHKISTMVSELAKADNLPMPKLYYVDTPIPNAFATGRNPKHAVVAVTTGILDILNDAELKAVLGHELGHVKNRDMLVSTVAATIAGAISYIAQLAMFANLFGGDEDAPNPIAAIAMMILAPLAATLIQLAVSRSREFLADQHGAHLMGNGKDLASALQKLNDFKHSVPPLQPSPTEQASAHLMFTNMFSMQGFAGLFSTHPSTEARVERLHKFNARQAERGVVSGPILERR